MPDAIDVGSGPFSSFVAVMHPHMLSARQALEIADVIVERILIPVVDVMSIRDGPNVPCIYSIRRTPRST